MKRKLGGRASYANVVATVALFLALGGTAMALTKLPANSVGAKQLKKGAVSAAKVRRRSLLAADFKAGQLPAGPRGPAGATGPQGSAGAPGRTGATNVVTRYGLEVSLSNGQGKGSYAACAAGEAVTGGGYEFVEGDPANSNFVIGANRASLEATPGIHALPPDGGKATGWLVAMSNTTTLPFKFRAFAQCASP
jgi:hypothetical protein